MGEDPAASEIFTGFGPPLRPFGRRPGWGAARDCGDGSLLPADTLTLAGGGILRLREMTASPHPAPRPAGPGRERTGGFRQLTTHTGRPADRSDWRCCRGRRRSSCADSDRCRYAGACTHMADGSGGGLHVPCNGLRPREGRPRVPRARRGVRGRPRAAKRGGQRGHRLRDGRFPGPPGVCRLHGRTRSRPRGRHDGCEAGSGPSTPGGSSGQ